MRTPTSDRSSNRAVRHRWVLAAVRNALSFCLIVAATIELLAGVAGMGSLLQNSTADIQTETILAVTVILSVVGLALHGAAVLRRRFALRWEA